MNDKICNIINGFIPKINRLSAVSPIVVLIDQNILQQFDRYLVSA